MALNTLVIGGAGYIGSHLVSQLVATGRKVTVLGRGAAPKYELPKEVTYVAGDFFRHGLINDLLDANDEVIQLAYATVPNTSFDDPLVDLLQNLPATVQLFSEAAKRGLRLVLVSSGGTVYGEAALVPVSEEHPTHPISPYGVTKLTLERYAYLYAATHGLKFVCVRPANAYGVGQRPFIGQGFVATAMASAIQQVPIRIFGEKGSVRDYLYVSDIAGGVLRALESGSLSQTYNLGSGTGLSNLDVIEAFRPMVEEVGGRVMIEYLPERAFDVKRNVLDSDKLRRETGWKPLVGLEDGMRMTRDWLVEQLR